MATAATTKVSIRFPNSMALWTPMARCGTNDSPEQRGHGGQPRPEPVSRTTPPVTTIRMLTTSDAIAAGRIQRLAHDCGAVREAEVSVWVTPETISAPRPAGDGRRGGWGPAPPGPLRPPGAVGVVEVDLEEVGGGVELDVGVVAGGGSGGGAGGGDLVGAGVVGQVDLAVRVAPEVDAGEGLAGGPVAVGLDPVVEPAQRCVVPDPGQEVLGHRAVGGRGMGQGVVDVDGAGGVGGVGEGVGGGEQVHGFAVPVGDLVCRLLLENKKD